MQNFRKGLRGVSAVLMSKNAIMKHSIRFHVVKTSNQAFFNFVPLLVGNVGLVFTRGDLKEMSEEVAKYKARVPICVVVAATSPPL